MDNVNPIAHLSVRPSSDSSFSELDIIRLITPFGSRQENYIPDSDIYFEIKGKLMNREQLLMSLLEIREEGKIVNIEEGASQFDINSIRPQGRPLQQDYLRTYSRHIRLRPDELCRSGRHVPPGSKEQ